MPVFSLLTGTQAVRLHGRESVREVLVRIQLKFIQSSLDFLQKSAKQSKRGQCCNLLKFEKRVYADEMGRNGMR
jgi:hypothetical protein